MPLKRRNSKNVRLLGIHPRDLTSAQSRGLLFILEWIHLTLIWNIKQSGEKRTIWKKIQAKIVRLRTYIALKCYWLRCDAFEVALTCTSLSRLLNISSTICRTDFEGKQCAYRSFARVWCFRFPSPHVFVFISIRCSFEYSNISEFLALAGVPVEVILFHFYLQSRRRHHDSLSQSSLQICYCAVL